MSLMDGVEETDAELIELKRIHNLLLTSTRASAFAVNTSIPQDVVRQMWAEACLEEAHATFEYEGMRLEGVEGCGVRDIKLWFETLMYRWCLHLQAKISSKRTT